MIKVKADDNEFEVNPDQLELPEGYGLITPDSIPKGYFTQEALDKKAAEINKSKVDKAVDVLKSDKDFHREILSEYNISLDDNGKPKGLKPDFDPDEWKKNEAKQLTKPLQEELRAKDDQLSSFKQGLIRAEILKAANGRFKEEFTKSYTGNDDPFVVKQFADQFDVDETGNVAMKDKDGTFTVTGDGSRLTPDKFFTENADKFSSLMQDNRQTGSGFKGGANGAGKTSFTREEIKRMSTEEYKKNENAINKALSEGNIK